jgi:biotin carboxyl carrier protein
VSVGQEIAAGDTVVVMEAMKMENNITASGKAKVKRILVTEGQMVDNKMQLLELES